MKTGQTNFSTDNAAQCVTESEAYIAVTSTSTSTSTSSTQVFQVLVASLTWEKENHQTSEK